MIIEIIRLTCFMCFTCHLWTLTQARAFSLVQRIYATSFCQKSPIHSISPCLHSSPVGLPSTRSQHMIEPEPILGTFDFSSFSWHQGCWNTTSCNEVKIKIVVGVKLVATVCVCVMEPHKGHWHTTIGTTPLQRP